MNFTTVLAIAKQDYATGGQMAMRRYVTILEAALEDLREPANLRDRLELNERRIAALEKHNSTLQKRLNERGIDER